MLENQILINLYKANKNLCVIIVLGQGKHYGMALLSKTKSDEYFNGIACESMSKSKKANKPSDESMAMKLAVELDQLQLKAMRDFYYDMGQVMDKYKVSKTIKSCAC